MNNWKETTLGDIADFRNGKGLNNALYTDEGQYPVWGANGQIARTNELLNEQSVVVIGRVGAYCGSVHAVYEPNWVTDNAIVSTPKSGSDFRFLYYLLTYLRPERTSIGSAQPLITQSGLKILKCYIPVDLSEQKAIAHILGSLDDKIELNRQMNQTLEAMAQALFKSWFVDFAPVIDNALAAVNPIPEELAEKAHRRKALGGKRNWLPKGIKDLFPNAFEDSKLGPIPKGWKVEPLDKIAEFLNGLACQKYPPKDGERALPVIKIRELRQGISANTDLATENVPEQYIVNDGDVLFSWSGSLLVDIWSQGRGVLNQHVFKVYSERYPKWFYYYWTAHHLMEFQRIAADKATTMGHIKRHHLSDAKVLVPSEPLLEAMSEHLASFLEHRLNNELEAKTLSKLRDTLLPKLISGELRVPRVEKLLGACHNVT